MTINNEPNPTSSNERLERRQEVGVETPIEAVPHAVARAAHVVSTSAYRCLNCERPIDDPAQKYCGRADCDKVAARIIH